MGIGKSPIKFFFTCLAVIIDVRSQPNQLGVYIASNRLIESPGSRRLHTFCHFIDIIMHLRIQIPI